MDRNIFETLKIVVQFAEQTMPEKSSRLRTAVNQLTSWMQDVEIEIEDYETLGTDRRPPLEPTN
jgi:hypothetical protein